MQVEFRSKSRYGRFIDIFVDQVFFKQGAKQVFKKEKQGSFQTKKEMEKWLYKIEYRGAKEYAYLLLSYQSYPSALLRKKLLDYCIDPKIVQKIIQEFTDLGYVDDKQWIESFIEKLLDNGWGPYVILQKLKQKNIQVSLDLIEKVATVDVQKQAIDKYLNKRKKIQIHQTLARRGFSFSVIDHWQESQNFL